MNQLTLGFTVTQEAKNKSKSAIAAEMGITLLDLIDHEIKEDMKQLGISSRIECLELKAGLGQLETKPRKRSSRTGIDMWSVSWGTPYTEPPNGQSRTLFRGAGPEAKAECVRILDLFYEPGGSGYSGTFDYIDNRPKRKWSEEAKKRERRSRLANRVRAKYSIPAMFDEVLAREIAAKPNYF
jgi:hypothetical protein